MRIENDVKLDFKDVLIRPKRSTLTTRSQVDISREFRFRHTGTDYAGIPIVASNMDSTGTVEMARALDGFKLSVALHKHYGVDEIVAFFRALERKSAAFYSMGIARPDEDKFEEVMRASPGDDHSVRYVFIDVANGYTESFVRFVKKIRERHPHLVIMAGNVVTGEMTEELILSGADIVKVGIGPGSVCTTRKVTEDLSKLGSNLLIVQPGRSMFGPGGAGQDNRSFDDRTIAKLPSELTGVRAIAPATPSVGSPRSRPASSQSASALRLLTVSPMPERSCSGGQRRT